MTNDPAPHKADGHESTETDAQLRANDTRLLTPILLMALIIAVGLLLFAVTGQGPAAS